MTRQDLAQQKALQIRGHGGGRRAATVAERALDLGLYLIVVFVTAVLKVVLVYIFGCIDIVRIILSFIFCVAFANLLDSAYDVHKEGSCPISPMQHNFICLVP